MVIKKNSSRTDFCLRNGTIVCFTNDSWDSALSQVRLRGPLKAAGFNVIPGNDREKKLLDDLSDVDFVVIQRDFPQYTDLFLWILEEIRSRQIPLVYEIDDLLFTLPENHPLQRDGSYSRNYIPMLLAISRADMVSVSTEPLACFLQPFNANIKVLPNYLNEDIWQFMPVTKNNSGDSPVTIGYIGGSTHQPDILLIVDALNRIQEEFGQRIHYKFWGVEPPQTLISPRKIDRQHIVAGYADYAAAFRDQKIDILIAPLEDNLFNQSKSHLKYLEYSTLGVPGVFSKVKAFEDVVKHGVTGFLATTEDEWVACLRGLITSPELRCRMAVNAQESVKQHYLLSSHADEWAEAYASLENGSAGSQNSSENRLIAQEEMLKQLRAPLEKEEGQPAENIHQELPVKKDPPKIITTIGRLLPTKIREFLKRLFKKGY